MRRLTFFDIAPGEGLSAYIVGPTARSILRWAIAVAALLLVLGDGGENWMLWLLAATIVDGIIFSFAGAILGLVLGAAYIALANSSSSVCLEGAACAGNLLILAFLVRPILRYKTYPFSALLDVAMIIWFSSLVTDQTQAPAVVLFVSLFTDPQPVYASAPGPGIKILRSKERSRNVAAEEDVHF